MAHWLPAVFPPETGRRELRADAAIHALAMIASAAAGTWLIGALDPAAPHIRAMLAIYVFAMAAMFVASAIYHGAPPGRLKRIAQKIDHALIFAAIAGTFTPLLALRLAAPVGNILCLSAWAAAAIGIGMTIVTPCASGKQGTAPYLVLAWAGLAVALPLGLALQPLTSGLIVGGCLIYTAGAGAYRARRFRYQSALWHALVLVAASVHFAAMAVEFTAPAA